MTLHDAAGAIPAPIGSDGYVYPEGDIAALAATLAALVATPKTAAPTVPAHALRDDTWPAVAARRHTLYHDMLEGAAF